MSKSFTYPSILSTQYILSLFFLIIFIGYDEMVVTPFDLSWSEDPQFQSMVYYYMAHFWYYT